MTDRIQAIREALAAGPTQGEWVFMHAGEVGENDFEVADVDRERVVAVDGMGPNVKLGAQIVDAKFIAACNPLAISELLKAHDEAVRRADELESLRALAVEQAERLIVQRDHWQERCIEVAAEMQERCARAVEALRDDHCASTAVGDAGYDACSIDSPECEFVVAWNDAAAAIRSLSSTTGATNKD